MNEVSIIENREALPRLAGLTPKVILEEYYQEETNCQIAAFNDLQAMRIWLALYRVVPRTYLAYRREVERLLLWCSYERGAVLRQLKVEDFARYFTFLKNPPPYWCASRAARGSVNWRPFVGALTESTFSAALRILNSFLNYLTEAQYLCSNPIKLIRKQKMFAIDLEQAQYRIWERMLEADEWQAVQQSLEAMPEDSTAAIANKMRTQFLFALGYLLGLRIQEMASHSWNAFRKWEGNWWVFIKGKGGKLRHVPVNDQLLSFVKVYRLSLGKPALPSSEEQEPWFVSKRTGKALSTRQLCDLVKAIGREAAKQFEDQPLKARRLRKFSTHWLRHLSASHQDKADIPLGMIRETLGHSSEAITQIYRHAENERRHQEMQKMQLNVVPRLIRQEAENKEVQLSLIFKAQPRHEAKSFARLLEVIEDEVFQGLAWQREDNKAKVLQTFLQKKRYGEDVIVNYRLKEIREEDQVFLKKAILRESEIRLFECEIKSHIYEENDDISI